MGTTTFIDDLGFHRVRLDQRKAALEALWQGIFGADIDLTPQSMDGQQIGILAEAIADIDALAEAVFNGRSAAAATGDGLARLVRLNGITKAPATFSTAGVVLSGTPGTVIPAGSIVNSNTTPPTAWVTTGVSPANDLTIGGGGTVAGTIQASVGGPILGPAGTLNQAMTVISGWTGVTNPLDALVGTSAETDAALRVRRAASVAVPSQALIDGIAPTIENIAGVVSAICYENSTDSVDARGLPPHSTNLIVAGGDPNLIGAAYWAKRSCGATMVGSTLVSIVDGQGFTQVVKFDRPTPTTIYVTVHLSSDPGPVVRNGIITAIVAAGLTLPIGAKVVWGSIFPIVLGQLPVGTTITSVLMGTAPTPTLQADVVIGVNAISSWDPTADNTGPIKILTP